MRTKTARQLSTIVLAFLILGMLPFFSPSEGGFVSCAGTKTMKVSMDVFKHMNIRKGAYKKYKNWKSSNKSIVNVSKKGKLYSQKPGTATITAKKGKKKAKWIITVTNKNGRYLSKTYSYDLGWDLLDEAREFSIYPPTVRVAKNEITSVGVNVFGLPKERETFIYLDRKLDQSSYVWGLQTSVTINGDTTKLGKHNVSVVQYKDDDPTKSPVICLTRSFKVKRPR